MALEYSGIERRLDELSERLGKLEPLRARIENLPQLDNLTRFGESVRDWLQQRYV